MEPAPEVRSLIGELNRATLPELSVWLRSALSNRERRLPLGRDETPVTGVMRLWPHLTPDAHDFLRQAAVILLREWLLSEPWPVAQEWPSGVVNELFELLHAFHPPEATTLFWALIANREHFDRLPRSQQIDVQNLLEQWGGPVSTQIWLELASRDIVRFGVSAFGALARVNLRDALTLLPQLPATNEIADSLALKIRRLLSTLPSDDPAASLQAIAEAVRQADPIIQHVFKSGFAQCGSPLPGTHEFEKFKPIPLRAFHTIPNPRRAVGCDALSRSGSDE